MYVAEIFESFHGEINGHHQGRLVTFIRLSGCNLKCHYCDTAKTQDPYYGLNLTKEAIIQQIKDLDNKYICLTGGEPLLNQSEAKDLIYKLWLKGFKISVETNGTIPIVSFRRFVQSFVLDYKMDNKSFPYFDSENIAQLTKKDVVKFVIRGYQDYQLTRSVISHFKKHYPHIHPIYALSPMYPDMSGEDLAKMILDDKIPNIVLSLQIHKILNCR